MIGRQQNNQKVFKPSLFMGGPNQASLFLFCNTISLSLANFVGCVVDFLNVCKIRLRNLLLAAALSFEIEMV
jgi:hypothetical protein